MNKLNIEKLAREAGLKVGTNISGVRLVGVPIEHSIAHLTPDDLERFAALVRHEVLEEVAKVAEEKYQEMASKGFPREASAARALAKTYRSIKQNL